MNLFSRILIYSVAVLALVFTPKSTFAQFKHNKNIPHVNGEVNNIQAFGDTIFLGGSFTEVHHQDSLIEHFYIIDSSLSEKRPIHIAVKGKEGEYLKNKTYAIVDDGRGGWILSGAFVQVGDSLRNGLAQIDSNGIVTSLFSDFGPLINTPNHPYYVKRFGDSLFVYGDFHGMIDPNEAHYMVYQNQDTTFFINHAKSGGFNTVVSDDSGGFYLFGAFNNYGDSICGGGVHVDSMGRVLSDIKDIDFINSSRVIGSNENSFITFGIELPKKTDWSENILYSGGSTSPNKVAQFSYATNHFLNQAYGSKSYYVFNDISSQSSELTAHKGLIRYDSMHVPHFMQDFKGNVNMNNSNTANEQHLFIAGNFFDTISGNQMLIKQFDAVSGKLYRQKEIEDFQFLYDLFCSNTILVAVGRRFNTYSNYEIRFYNPANLVEYTEKRLTLAAGFSRKLIDNTLLLYGANLTINGTSHTNYYAFDIQSMSPFPSLEGITNTPKNIAYYNDSLYVSFDSNYAGGTIININKYHLKTGKKSTTWNAKLISKSYFYSNKYDILCSDSGVLWYTNQTYSLTDSLVGSKFLNSRTFILNHQSGNLVWDAPEGTRYYKVFYSNSQLNAFNYPPSGNAQIGLLNKKSGDTKSLGLNINGQFQVESSKDKILFYSTQSNITLNSASAKIHIVDTLGYIYPFVYNGTFPIQQALIYDTLVLILEKQQYNNRLYFYGLNSNQLITSIYSNNQINTMVINHDTLFLAGSFSNIMGYARSGFCSFSLPDIQLSSLGKEKIFPSFTNISVITVSDDYVHLSGEFEVVGIQNEVEASHYAQINKVTSLPEHSEIQVYSWPKSFHFKTSGNNLIMAPTSSGSGQNLRFKRLNRIFAVNLQNGSLILWKSGVDDYIKDIEKIDDKIYLAGKFTKAGGKNIKLFARFSGMSQIADSIPLSITGSEVNFILPYNGNLFLRGSFTHVNGQSTTNSVFVSRSNYGIQANIFSGSPILGCIKYLSHGKNLYGLRGSDAVLFDTLSQQTSALGYCIDIALKQDQLIRAGNFEWNTQTNDWLTSYTGYNMLVDSAGSINLKFANQDYAITKIIQSGTQYLAESEAVDCSLKATHLIGFSKSTGELINLDFKFKPLYKSNISKVQILDNKLAFRLHGASINGLSRNSGLHLLDLNSRTIDNWNLPFTETIEDFYACGGTVALRVLGSFKVNGTWYNNLLILDTSGTIATNTKGIIALSGTRRDRYYLNANISLDTGGSITKRDVILNLDSLNYIERSLVDTQGYISGLNYFRNNITIIGGTGRVYGTANYPYLRVYDSSKSSFISALVPQNEFESTCLDLFEDGNKVIVPYSSTFVGSSYFVPEKSLISGFRTFDKRTGLLLYANSHGFTKQINSVHYDPNYGIYVGGNFNMGSLSSKPNFQFIGKDYAPSIALSQKEYCGFPDTLSCGFSTIVHIEDSVTVNFEILQLVSGFWESKFSETRYIPYDSYNNQLFTGLSDTGDFLLVATLQTDKKWFTDQVNFRINEKPHSKIKLNTDPIQCLKGNMFALSDSSSSSSSKHYSWYLNSQIVDTSYSFQHHFSQVDSAEVRLKIELDNHCSSIDSVWITTQPHPYAALDSVELTYFCAGDLLNLNADSTNNNWTFTWFLDDIDLNSSSNTVSVYQQGYVKYKVTDSLGCITWSDSIFISKIPLPLTPVITGPDTVRVGDTAQFLSKDSSSFSYYWNSGNSHDFGITDSSILKARWSWAQLDSISLMVENKFGCFSPIGIKHVFIERPDSIVVFEDTLYFTSKSDSAFLHIYANIPWQNVNPIPTWIRLSDSIGTGTDSIQVAVSRNFGANRSAWIVFGNQILDSVFVLQVNALTINHIDKDALLKIYPNPAHDFIQLESSSAEALSVRILDSKGSIVAVYNLDSQAKRRIDLSNWSSGIYIVEYGTKDQVLQLKLILH